LFYYIHKSKGADRVLVDNAILTPSPGYPQTYPPLIQNVEDELCVYFIWAVVLHLLIQQFLLSVIA